MSEQYFKGNNNVEPRKKNSWKVGMKYNKGNKNNMIDNNEPNISNEDIKEIEKKETEKIISVQKPSVVIQNTFANKSDHLDKYDSDIVPEGDNEGGDIIEGEKAPADNNGGSKAKPKGESLILLIDTIVPIAATLILKLLTGKDIDEKEFELTDREIRILEPFADKAAEDILGGANDTHMFFIMLGVILMGKIKPHISGIRRKKVSS